MTCESDLLVIGGGPAGLTAAINGASEGLKVRLLDSGAALGGQARESSGIENYPGFPESISGSDLMNRFVQQAHRFNTSLLCPVAVASIRKDGDWIVADTDDYQEYSAKAVILSIGLSYRRLEAKDVGRFMGRGVFYGAPSPTVINSRKPAELVVVGGANSAGQAAVGLSWNKKANVRLVIRKTIDAQMSTYLIERIAQTPNITVMENSQVEECCGGPRLEDVTIRTGDKCTNYRADGMYVFIGAVPRTMWLKSIVALDNNKYIRTEHDGGLPFETDVKGVFAAGDVRSGSIKRIASASGEGACALQQVHRYLGGL